MFASLLGLALSGGLYADTPPAPPTPAPGAEALQEVMVQAPEPKYVAPTRRDRIGRIWAPVMIDGKGPFRLVLDTGANRSAVTQRTAAALGLPEGMQAVTRVTGFTGSAVVPTIHVGEMDVGDILIGPAELPVLDDVFGGAQGVLGYEGLANRRIFADFIHDRLVISRSHGERAPRDFTTVALRVMHGLLVADVMVGGVRTKAIIDTGAQGTVGNLKLRDALMRHPPRNAAHEEIIGVTLDVQSGDYLPMPDIRFGDRLMVSGVHVTFGDMYLFEHWGLTDEPALTLGMDLLGTFDVMIIDYARRELQIQLHNTDLRFP
ncbi:MAG TPA: aspartyl protease family protein [Steroidobacteraceae bacterium]|nr:aspartyl protease family protein [Steroidobacteraceae bacterium]